MMKKLIVLFIGLMPLFLVAQPLNDSRALDFSITDYKGKELKLSDFRGKLVLLDFWASWCGPCRHENKNVVEAYDKYKKKKFINANGFTVISISLDREEQRWRDAIKDDDLKWKNHAWDVDKLISSKYVIRSIPYGFLIDGEGKIIAQGKELRGIGLHLEIEKQLK